MELHSSSRHGNFQPASRVLDGALVLELRRKRTVLGEQVVTWTQCVTAGDDRQTAVLLGRIVQKDHDRQEIEVGMREERIVLVPLETRFTAARRFEIELRMVELDIWADQVLHHVEN